MTTLFGYFISMVLCGCGVLMGAMGFVSGGEAFPLGLELSIPSVILFYVFYRMFVKKDKEIFEKHKI